MSDDKRLIEQEGVGVFTVKSSHYGGLVRNTDTHDKGIDAELEVSNSFSVKGRTPFIGVQIKSRTEAIKLANGDFSVTVTEQNIDYWSRYG